MLPKLYAIEKIVFAIKQIDFLFLCPPGYWMEFCGVMICGSRSHQHKALLGTEYSHTADEAAGDAAVVVYKSLLDITF